MASDISVSRCVINGRVCLEGLCSRQNVCFKSEFDDMSPEKFIDYVVRNPMDSASVLHYLSVSSAMRTENIFAAAEIHPYFTGDQDRSHGKPVNPILTLPYEFVSEVIVKGDGE